LILTTDCVIVESPRHGHERGHERGEDMPV
jgi:hypothetical protein